MASGYQEQLGVSGMQIQYNCVTLYTKTILRNAFSILMHILSHNAVIRLR